MAVKRKELGREGEKAAAELLEAKGYRILEQNYRTRYGEIDIIAAKGTTLVFVEVKTRASTRCGIPEEAVDFRKQQKIRKLAVEYLSRTCGQYYSDLRFDVVAISVGAGGKIEKVNLYEGAF